MLLNYSEASGRNASKVVLYEDASKKKLREFTVALRGCESMVNACSSLQNILNDNNSSLLHRLLTPGFISLPLYWYLCTLSLGHRCLFLICQNSWSSGKGFPDILSDLKYFKDAFDWEDADKTGRIIPRAGGDLEYDLVYKNVKEIQLNLKNYLKEQHKLLKDTSVKSFR